MASIFNKRGKYWLKYFDPETQSWRIKPTPLIYPDDKRKAKALKSETTAKELLSKGAHHVPNDQRWNSWVPGYMDSRYRNSPKTLARYTNSWSHISSFLDEAKIAAPAAWRSEHNMQYVDWKTGEKRTKSGDKALKQTLHRSRNVAIWDPQGRRPLQDLHHYRSVFAQFWPSNASVEDDRPGRPAGDFPRIAGNIHLSRI